MKLLFLDDSSSREAWYAGYGGFSIDSGELRGFSDGLQSIKHQFGIPSTVEVKWSPEPGHFLRSHFKGTRHDLYREVLGLLPKHRCQVMCAVHALRECYGVALHGWTRAEATLWAAKQQLRFLAERFEKPLLTAANDYGMIVCDQFSTRGEDAQVAQHFSYDMLFGTAYRTMERIPHVPLMTESKHSPPVQVADIVVGITTSAISGGKYGIALFEHVAPHMLWNPHEHAISFACSLSSGVLGYGLKVFPNKLLGSAEALFAELDKQYLVTNDGVKRREVLAG